MKSKIKKGGGEELQRDSGETFLSIPLKNSFPPFPRSEPSVPSACPPTSLTNTKGGLLAGSSGGVRVGEGTVQGGVLWPEFPPFPGPGVVTTPP